VSTHPLQPDLLYNLRQSLLVHNPTIRISLALSSPLLPNISKPQVRLNLPNIILPKLLLRICRANGRRHNDIFPRRPVNRRSNALLITRLQRINHTQHLGGIATCRGGIHHGETDFLGRVDDEHGADRKGDALLVYVGQVLLVHHVVQPCDLAFRVCDDGELQV
jgi:hypothetical protein